ncbi:hypothetical protein LINPERHAP1_LOCUS17768 [Linum perenne]
MSHSGKTIIILMIQAWTSGWMIFYRPRQLIHRLMNRLSVHMKGNASIHLWLIKLLKE